MDGNWIANKKMRDLLNDIESNLKESFVEVDLFQLHKLLFPHFICVNDCIIISNDSLEKLETSFENALRTYKDRTGYEACNTEIRINDYFIKPISMHTATTVAMLVIECWSTILKRLDPYSRFCFILGSDEERVEIRFHKVRKEEDRWLAEDIESYVDGAIGYIEL